MARIRPRAQTTADPDTVAGRPLDGAPVPPPDDELDELAGVEAFAPRDDGDFGRAFAQGRRGEDPETQAALLRTSLVVAVAVLVAGLLTVAFGVVDDGDGDVRSDEVATVATTSSTAPPSSTSSTSSTSTTSPTSTSTTAGFTPGTTATTVRRTTITTVRPSTTLPQATTTTPTTALPNRPLRVEISIEGDLHVGQSVVVTVFTVDPDAVPRCEVVRLNGDLLFDDPCEPEDCPANPPPVADNGGDRTFAFNRTFTTAGSYTFEVTARSGVPECGNPYADVGTDSITVTVT